MCNSENDLEPDELERLAIIMEEMGETIQIIGKIQRHGYASFNPNISPSPHNRDLLEKELAHVFVAFEMMRDSGDVNNGKILDYMTEKRESIKNYLHYVHFRK